MGLGDRLGSVGEGKTASLVLVRANPLEDVRNAEQIEGVFLRGRYFGRDDLDRLLVGGRERWRIQRRDGVIYTSYISSGLQFSLRPPARSRRVALAERAGDSGDP